MKASKTNMSTATSQGIPNQVNKLTGATSPFSMRVVLVLVGEGGGVSFVIVLGMEYLRSWLLFVVIPQKNERTIAQSL
jgi:hypothetical protein